jgi:ABC-type multidrug transport system fused ATPase/permease subunit
MFNVIAAIALIVAGTPYLAAFIPPSTVALYLLQKYYLRTSRQMRHLDLEAKSPLYTLFSETSAGIRTVRANGWQAAFSRRCTELLDLSQKPYYLLFCIQRWLSLVLDLYVAGLAVLLVGFALGLMRNTTQAGMGLAMINLIGFGQMLSQVVSSWTNVETSLGAVARLRSFVTDTPVEPASRGEPESHPLTRWPSQGRVELVSVSARYNNDDPTAPLALKDVSLTIEPGQTVGLVGRTGRYVRL